MLPSNWFIICEDEVDRLTDDYCFQTCAQRWKSTKSVEILT